MKDRSTIAHYLFIIPTLIIILAILTIIIIVPCFYNSAPGNNPNCISCWEKINNQKDFYEDFYEEAITTNEEDTYEAAWERVTKESTIKKIDTIWKNNFGDLEIKLLEDLKINSPDELKYFLTENTLNSNEIEFKKEVKDALETKSKIYSWSSWIVMVCMISYFFAAWLDSE